MFNRSGLWAPSIAMALHLGLGCSGSSDSSPPPRPNLSPTAVAVLTAPADVQAAHRLDVQVELSSVTAVQAVGVTFVAFPKAEYDAHAETIASYVLGGSAYDVPEGGGTFTATLQIPPTVPAGDYYVVPVVDPLNTIAETDEGDQYGATAPVVINVDHANDIQLMIEEAVLDAPAVELEWAEPGKPGFIGLTLRLRAEASAPVSGAQLAAVLRGPGATPVTLPLSIWDPATSARQATFAVPTLLPGEPHSVDLDLALAPDLSDELDGLLKQVVDACIDPAGSPATCSASLGMNKACVESCLTKPPPVHYETLKPCMLKCVPFTVEATLDKPGAVLYEPPGAAFGRTIAADLQLIASPAIYPISIRAMNGTEIVPIWDPIYFPWPPLSMTCSPETLEFRIDRGACTEPVVWSVGLVEGQVARDTRGPGSLGPQQFCTGWGWWTTCTPGDPDIMVYTPEPEGAWRCDDRNPDMRVLVQATACGTTASIPVTIKSGGYGLPGIQPETKEFVAGQGGEVEFQAIVSCAPEQLTWTLEPADAARLPGGAGTLASTSGLAVRYSPPPSITAGEPVTIKVRAQAPACGSFDSTATVRIALPKELRYEMPFARTFSNDLFGVGIDLYAGALMDSTGARANAHAIVPAKIFGADLDLLRVTDDANVDPRPGGTSSFVHHFDAFGSSLDTWSCPGNPKCTSEAEIWSGSKCIPEGPPPLCKGTSYATACQRNLDCAGLGEAGLSCLDGYCTKKCDSPNDCSGFARFCAGSLEPGPYKKVFLIAVVPVTVEGKICLDYGIDAGIDLLTSGPETFEVQLNPYLQASGYASVAVGYTGLLAIGVKGEVIVLRHDFYGITSATVSDVPCSLAGGCVAGTLAEGVENVIQGPLGELSLFADYPTLQWCDWAPCVGVARAEQVIASIGPAFEVENRCDACIVDGDCAAGTCVGGFCADGFPGLLCAKQSVIVGSE